MKNPTNETMSALVLHGVGDLRFQEVARPTPGKGTVLIRVGACGVCGSDMPRIFSKGTYRFPTICGHEFAGVISAVGPDVLNFKVNDRVAVFPLVWCGKCSACETGNYVQCHDYDYLGSRCDGAFAEYVVAPVENLIKVPDNVSIEEAAFTEPAAVALHALRRAECKAGDEVVIFGAGPIGLIVAQWAKIMGASRVTIFDVIEEKLSLARKLGFESIFNSRTIDPNQRISELTSGEGAHVCIEAAGVPSTTIQALRSARRRGKVVLLGNPSSDVTLPVEIISQIMRREVNVIGTWNSQFLAHSRDDDWRTVLKAMASKQLDLLPLISHRVPLDQGIRTLEAMKQQSGFFCKTLIVPAFTHS